MIVTKKFGYGQKIAYKVQQRLDKYESLAAKLGCPAPTWTRKTVTVVPVVAGKICNHLQYDHHWIEWTGVVPVVNGWTLVAKLEWAQGGVIVSCVPGESLGAEYRQHDGHCDHCKTKRRRHQVYVVRHEDGRQATVGSDCLQDFLRTDVDLLPLINGKLVDSVDDDAYGFAQLHHNPMQVLTLGSFLIRRHGWTSKKKADEQGIASTYAWFTYVTNNPGKYIEREGSITEEDRDVETAEQVIQWAATKAEDENDYLRNISVLCRSEHIAENHIPTLLSAIAAYQREVDAANRVRPETAHLDVEVGKRFRKLAVTVKRLRYFDSYYGTTCIVAMEAEQDGTVVPLVWFTTSSQDLREGEQVEIDGTVKEHKSDDKYGPQTVVSRVKIYSATA